MLGRLRLSRQLAMLGLALMAAIVLGAAGGLAADKKIIRINHAGADDIVGTEHQMFAWVFANYVNSKSPTLDVKIFPNSGLGQSRQVIEAMAAPGMMLRDRPNHR